MYKTRFNKLVAGFLLAMLFGCESQSNSNMANADLVIVNAKIVTSSTLQPAAQAIAIRDGKIVAIGTNEEISASFGDATKRIDAGGNTVMPGINDGHSHPVLGGSKLLYECNFPFDATVKKILATVSDCVGAMSDDLMWLNGGQWTSNFFVDNDIESPRALLDGVSGDKAVVLIDDSGHNAWVNSKALEVLNIDEGTQVPEGMQFLTDSEGRLNGLLYESFALLSSAQPKLTAEQLQAAAKEAVRSANRFGVTGIKDASAEHSEAAAFLALDQSEVLTAHIALSLLNNDHSERGTLPDVAIYEEMRDRYRSKHINSSAIKIFLDGVPTASRTAAMLAPYIPQHGEEEPNYGELHVQPEELARAVVAYDKAGFTIKIHAAGDRSIRVALDAIQVARETNGSSGLRHELAHAEFIDPIDLPRFQALNVVAGFDLSPKN